jgi:hypothetical protein
MKQHSSRLCIVLALSFLNACGSSSPTQPSTPSSPAAPASTPAPPAPSPALPPQNLPPVPDFKVRPFPLVGVAPFAVNFNLCPTADPEGDPLLFVFDFGDGETLQGPPCRFGHTYRAGRFRANMCVWDLRPDHSLVCVGYPVEAR